MRRTAALDSLQRPLLGWARRWRDALRVQLGELSNRGLEFFRLAPHRYPAACERAPVVALIDSRSGGVEREETPSRSSMGHASVLGGSLVLLSAGASRPLHRVGSHDLDLLSSLSDSLRTRPQRISSCD